MNDSYIGHGGKQAGWPPDGTAILCDCCGREKLGEIHACEGLEITDRRHGTHHVAFLGPRDVLERLSGTFAPDAILRYVKQVL